MKTTRGTLRTGRFRIPYRKYGDSERTLMCVSGALQTMAIWRTVVKRFMDRFSVVIFDMPGIGRSEIRTGTARVTVREQVDVVHALIEETHTGNELTLAGASWGTAIAAAYAAERPDAVQQLVLSSFGMKTNALVQTLVRRALDLYRQRDYRRGADLVLEMFGQQVGDVYKRQIVAQFHRLNDADAEVFYEHCRNILALGRLEEAVDLTRIAARTLIVNGADDAIVDLDDMWIAKQLIPDCECRLIDGVGHFLHFERPELLDVYSEFIVSPRPSTED
ncbi:MAG: alpha/beta hydrolase [Gammaproteobacteria bacterium]|nr:alpha/beta hydrolase [Gammaproteobacteria bacterium]